MEPKSYSKKVLNYVGAAFLVVLAICLIKVGVFSPWFQNIKAEITSQPYARTITVDANVKVSAKPDIASVTFAVLSEKASVKLVTADNNAKMNAVIDAIKKLGIEDKDITTSSYYLTPEYIYPKNGSQILTGYSLRQEITVKIRKLDIVDETLDTATKAGANEVGSLTFDIDDAGPLKKDAREKAFKKALEKAQDMASAANVKLGRVVTFHESTDSYISPYSNLAYQQSSSFERADMSLPPSPSIQPGSKEMNANVSVTYEIE